MSAEDGVGNMRTQRWDPKQYASPFSAPLWLIGWHHGRASNQAGAALTHASNHVWEITVLEIERRAIAGTEVAYTRLRGAKSLTVVDIHVMNQAKADLHELLQQPQLRCVILSGASEAAFVGGANLNTLGSLDQR